MEDIWQGFEKRKGSSTFAFQPIVAVIVSDQDSAKILEIKPDFCETCGEIKKPKERNLKLNGLEGRLAKLTDPLWYRRDYDNPAPLLVKRMGVDLANTKFKNAAVYELNFPYLIGDLKRDDDLYLFHRDWVDPNDPDEFLITWKRRTFLKHLAKHSITFGDIDAALRDGLQIKINKEQPRKIDEFHTEYPVAYFSVEKGRPVIFVLDNTDAKDARVQIAHELIHCIYRVSNCLDPRSFDKEEKPSTYELAQEFIEFEAQRIVHQNPELVDYAIRKTGLDRILESLKVGH